MIVYNVTVKIETSAHDEWLLWMKETHIPEMMATGYFLENNIYKILIEDDDGVNYSIQYSCSNMETLMEYQSEHAIRLQAKHKEKFKDKYVAFRTLLEKA